MFEITVTAEADEATKAKPTTANVEVAKLLVPLVIIIKVLLSGGQQSSATSIAIATDAVARKNTGLASFR